MVLYEKKRKKIGKFVKIKAFKANVNANQKVIKRTRSFVFAFRTDLILIYIQKKEVAIQFTNERTSIFFRVVGLKNYS